MADLDEKSQNILLFFLFVFIIGSLSVAVLSSQPSIFVGKLIEDPVAFFTMLLSVFTVALAFITLLVWIDTRENMRSQQAYVSLQIADAAESRQMARDSLLATKAAVKKAQRATQRELRAYLTIEVLAIDVPQFVGSKWLCEASIRISNNGKTPARLLNNMLKFYFFDWAEMSEEKILWPDGAISDEMSVAMLAPGQSVVLKGAHGLEPNMHGKDPRLCLSVSLRYRDEFKNNQCVKSLGSVLNTRDMMTAAQSGGSKINIHFEVAKIGNCAT